MEKMNKEQILKEIKNEKLRLKKRGKFTEEDRKIASPYYRTLVDKFNEVKDNNELLSQY